MAEKRNGTPKWLVKVLVLLLVSFVTWWATLIWSKQEETTETNSQQDVSILVLQKNIISVEKTVQRIETCLMEDRIDRRKQDSILMDVAIKVNIMFDGR